MREKGGYLVWSWICATGLVVDGDSRGVGLVRIVKCLPAIFKGKGRGEG